MEVVQEHFKEQLVQSAFPEGRLERYKFILSLDEALLLGRLATRVYNSAFMNTLSLDGDENGVGGGGVPKMGQLETVKDSVKKV